MAGQRQKGECYRSCLRGSLRGLNYLLAIVGVLMTAYALFMYVQWSDAAPVPPVPSPEPSPSPSPSHHKHHHHAPSPTSFDGSDTAASAIHELVNDGQEWEDSNLLDDLAERAESVHDEPSGKGALAKCASATSHKCCKLNVSLTDYQLCEPLKTWAPFVGCSMSVGVACCA